MKKKHFNKKLQLNKSIVSNLTMQQMRIVIGGNDGDEQILGDDENNPKTDNKVTTTITPSSVNPQASGVITVIGGTI